MKNEKLTKASAVVSALLPCPMKKHVISAAVMSCCLVSGAAMAAVETEGNDDFSSRNTFAAGVTVVDGSLNGTGAIVPASLDPADADYTFSATLDLGEIDSYVINNGFTPGSTFYSAIDNSASGVDTYIRTVDELGNTIDEDDDSSPFGNNGLADALFGNVNADGSIRVEVTGCCDSFAGTHDQSGDYDLLIFLGVEAGDYVDFLSFEGLTPGDALRAEISFADFDTTLGLFDEFGSLLESDDDGGVDVLSRLDVIVPDNGILTFAVSGYPDFSFDGAQHNEVGDYQLVLSPASAVPVPAAVWLFGSGLLGLAGVARRKQG